MCESFTSYSLCYGQSNALFGPPTVNFDYFPRRGESEKLKKEGGSVAQGQVFLNVED